MRPLRILTLEPNRNGVVSKDATAGIERLTYILDKELNKRGHHTTMIAREGSEITGDLIPIPEAWCSMTREHADFEQSVLAYLNMVLNQDFYQYDLILDHMTEIMLYAKNLPIPVVTVLHMPPVYYWDERYFGKPDRSNNHYVAITRTQKQLYEEKRIFINEVIYNGIDIENFPFTSEKEEYLLFIGRFVEEKGPHIAIETARRTGKKIILAGGPDTCLSSKDYFSHITGQADGVHIIYAGQIGLSRKLPLMQKALAVLMPSNSANGFQESAPLVCMESLACGTPVIALNNGSLPELIEHGKTGFICDSADQLAAAVRKIHEINPLLCRRAAEEKYSGSVMARAYDSYFRRILYT
ncbi:MAG: glycosyltransferase [Nanoarchaeota archaeon]